MAFQMEYKWRGFTYPESYWMLANHRFDRTSGVGTFEFYCYANKAARDESVSNIIGITKMYRTDKMLTDVECYEFAKACEDVDTENGYVSFFATASDV